MRLKGEIEKKGRWIVEKNKKGASAGSCAFGVVSAHFTEFSPNLLVRRIPATAGTKRPKSSSPNRLKGHPSNADHRNAAESVLGVEAEVIRPASPALLPKRIW